MNSTNSWDVKYEWRTVALLTVAFGLVGIDRFAINPLFPTMMQELHLDYQDLGNIAAVLSIAWGIGALMAGPMIDRLGRRSVMVPAVLVFSLMAGFTGLVGGITSILLLRVIMGLSEGAFTPASISATIDASKPNRRGLNSAIQQNGLPLFGLLIGPILATQVLKFTGSWRWTFAIIALPGLVVAYLLYRLIRGAPSPTAGNAVPAPRQNENAVARWKEALSYGNVLAGTFVMIMTAGALNTVIVMTPNYLVDFLHIDSERMGFITSGTGLGAIVGATLLTALSDRLGRKPVMFLCALLAAASVWIFINSPADPVRLFLVLAGITAFAFTVLYINVGPLAMESVPPHIAGTAVGVIVGMGEIVGGGLAPAFAGYIAKGYGIEHVFTLALVGLLLAAAIVLLVRKPAQTS